MDILTFINSLTNEDLNRIRNSKSDAEARRILKETNAEFLQSCVVGRSEQLKPKEQICYKSNEPCKYDCSGLCKESY